MNSRPYRRYLSGLLCWRPGVVEYWLAVVRTAADLSKYIDVKMLCLVYAVLSSDSVTIGMERRT